MAFIGNLQKISDTIWELPASYKQGMRVPARIYRDGKAGARDGRTACYEQVDQRRHCCPASRLCVLHAGWPLGLRIPDRRRGGHGSGQRRHLARRHRLRHQLRHAPGATNLTCDEVRDRIYTKLSICSLQARARRRGQRGFLKLAHERFPRLGRARRALVRGTRLRLAGRPAHTEESGCIPARMHRRVSDRAVERGYNQVGTLGSRQPLPRDPGRPAGARVRTQSSPQDRDHDRRSRWW